ncbi:MAG: hypothetical protein WCX28_00065 [Bacteriovoracaceae bacterium]|nr:hypothetical protein [Bacteroidota bacterium]
MNLTPYDYLPLIILIGVGAYVFKRQERRHHFEVSLFYTFEQLQQRILIPKRDILDSLLIIFIAATLLELGGLGLWTVLSMMSEVQTINHETTRRIIEESIPRQQLFTATLLGGGIALLILGIRSAVANKRYLQHHKRLHTTLHDEVA